jgi:hypothetical protein
MATTTFDNLITFSRGSNATVTGPNGLIQWAPSNLATNSQDMEAAAWVKNNSTVTANAAAAPDGSITADRVLGATTGTARGVYILVTTTANTHTISVYAKVSGLNWLCIYDPAGSAAGAAWFNLATGVLGTVASGYTAVILDVGNGWYRCSITRALAAGTNFPFFGGVDGDNTVTVSSTTNGVLLWGAQLELGSTATTYNNTSVRNLLGFSEAFDNAAWVKGNSSVVTGAQANPVNGLFNAQKLMEDTATSLHRLIVAATVTAIPYTMSVYAKAAERTWVAVGNTSDGQLAHFNLANGTVGTLAGGATATITNVGSGWYRCAVTFTPTAGSRTLAIWLASADNTLTYAGNGNSGVYIYGAMLSNSASLDPYVPTPGAAPSSTAYYGPRFDYDPVTLAARGLLVEEARTNLLLRSEEFDNASWSKTAMVTANQLVSPDGTSNADLVSTNSNFQYVRQSITATANAQLTVSFFVKPVSGSTTVRVLLSDGPQTEVAGSNFSLVGDGSLGTTFTVGTGVLTSRSITKLGNGWYRCVVSGTINTTTPFGLIDNHSGGTMSFGVYGAQLEAGAFATSYIPTIASTVTRSADVAVITGSLFSQWYNGVEGSFVASFTAAQNTFTTYIAASNGVVAQNSMHMDNDGSGNMRVAYYSGSSAVALLSLGTIGAVGTVNTLSTAYQANNFAASRNGGTVVSDTAGAVPVGVNRLNIGADPSGAAVNVSNGHIRSIRYVPVRAADFQLQQVTT